MVSLETPLLAISLEVLEEVVPFRSFVELDFVLSEVFVALETVDAVLGSVSFFVLVYVNLEAGIFSVLPLRDKQIVIFEIKK